jgi:hypothetical protein
MSSYTTMRAVPQAPPPPVFDNTISGVQARCPSNLLGAEGCEMLRTTLNALANGTAEVLKELDAELPEGSPLNAFRGWRRDKGDRERFYKTIQGREVEVRVGVALETRFEFTKQSVGQQLSAQEVAQQAREFNRQVNRQVNTVLALAASQWVGQKIQQRLDNQVKHTVRQRTVVANHSTGQVVRQQFTGFDVQGRKGG